LFCGASASFGQQAVHAEFERSGSTSDGAGAGKHSTKSRRRQPIAKRIPLLPGQVSCLDPQRGTNA
jgi:hypothetical protein